MRFGESLRFRRGDLKVYFGSSIALWLLEEPGDNLSVRRGECIAR